MAEKTALIAEKMATNWKAKIGYITISVGIVIPHKKTELQTLKS